MTHTSTREVPLDDDLYYGVERATPPPTKGLLLHLCLRRREGTFYYLDVWESKRAYQTASETRIHPGVKRVFLRGRPSIKRATNPRVVPDPRIISSAPDVRPGSHADA
jgi:hypothetical protein